MTCIPRQMCTFQVHTLKSQPVTGNTTEYLRLVKEDVSWQHRQMAERVQHQQTKCDRVSEHLGSQGDAKSLPLQTRVLQTGQFQEGSSCPTLHQTRALDCTAFR